MREIDAHVDIHTAAHFRPAVAEHPVLRQIVVVLHTAVKERKGVFVFIPLEKSHIIGVFRRGVCELHLLHGRALYHHKPRCNVFDLGEIVIDTHDGTHKIEIVSDHIVLHHLLVAHERRELGTILLID
jgi:hypothetical protein